jgi:hypothetical protein
LGFEPTDASPQGSQEGMKIIYAVFADSVIREGFGKIFAIPGRALEKLKVDEQWLSLKVID